MWKPVVGYEGLYEVSDDGVVRSLAFEIKKKVKGVAKIREAVELKQQIHRKGYAKVRLYKQTDWKQFFVHRLVAMMFIPNENNLTQVNHKDGNKLNNCVSNLEWISNTENMRHAYRTGIKVNPCGASASRAKLSEDSVMLAVKLRREGKTYREVARIVGCKLETVQRICSGSAWSSVTGIQKRQRNIAIAIGPESKTS
jgi:hypothetical protein